MVAGQPPDGTNMVDWPGREAPRDFVQAPDGPALAYVDRGAGPPVVLLHGTLTALEDMTLSPLEALAASYRVLAFDRPGFGRSEVRRFADAGVWRQAAHIQGALDRLSVERPIVVGHSF